MIKITGLGIVGLAGSGKDTVANHVAEIFGFNHYKTAGPLKDLCAEIFGWDRAALDDDDAARAIGRFEHEPSRPLFADSLAYKEAPSNHGKVMPWTYAFFSALADAQQLRIEPGTLDHLKAVFESITQDHTRREILQIVGTECFRALDQDHWVKRLRDRIRFDSISCDDAGSDEFRFVVSDVRFLNEATMLRHVFGAPVWRVEKFDGPGTSHGAHSSEQEQAEIQCDMTLSAAHGEIPKLLSQADMLLAQSEVRPFTPKAPA